MNDFNSSQLVYNKSNRKRVNFRSGRVYSEVLLPQFHQTVHYCENNNLLLLQE